MTAAVLSSESAVRVKGLTHRYKDRLALDGIHLSVQPAEIFGLLGPNGGGKTTLFRLLATALRIQQGNALVFGYDVAAEPHLVRKTIGVVFQSPSLDKKLTVRENLLHHGHLYGIKGPDLASKSSSMLERLGLADRAKDLVEKLSGGLARRVELAKGLLHSPKLLIMDEPSTGLDPGARIDLWRYLEQLKEDGVTTLLTTHLMDEAERCDRIAILDAGRVVALGKPAQLRGEVSGEVVTIRTTDSQAAAKSLGAELGIGVQVIDDSVRLETTDALAILPKLSALLKGDLQSLSIAKPTLEDVFIQKTGHRFWNEAPDG